MQACTNHRIFACSRSLDIFASTLHLRLSRISEKTTRECTYFLREISQPRVAGMGAEEGLWSTYESFIVALDNGDYFISGDASLARKRVHATRHGPEFLDGSPCQVCALADRNLFFAAVA